MLFRGAATPALRDGIGCGLARHGSGRLLAARQWRRRRLLSLETFFPGLLSKRRRLICPPTLPPGLLPPRYGAPRDSSTSHWQRRAGSAALSPGLLLSSPKTGAPTVVSPAFPATRLALGGCAYPALRVPRLPGLVQRRRLWRGVQRSRRRLCAHAPSSGPPAQGVNPATPVVVRLTVASYIWPRLRPRQLGRGLCRLDMVARAVYGPCAAGRGVDLAVARGRAALEQVRPRPCPPGHGRASHLRPLVARLVMASAPAASDGLVCPTTTEPGHGSFELFTALGRAAWGHVGPVAAVVAQPATASTWPLPWREPCNGIVRLATVLTPSRH